MGKRGPPKVPTKVLKIRGSWRAKGRPDEHDSDVSAPTCPSWLTDVAAKEWRRVVPLLRGRRTLQKIDLVSLAAYCQKYADYLALRAKLTHGVFSKEIHNAELKCLDVCLRLAREFGMTPSARASVPRPSGVAKPKAGTVMARLSKGAG